jgi:hypothetical protein
VFLPIDDEDDLEESDDAAKQAAAVAETAETEFADAKESKMACEASYVAI